MDINEVVLFEAAQQVLRSRKQREMDEGEYVIGWDSARFDHTYPPEPQAQLDGYFNASHLRAIADVLEGKVSLTCTCPCHKDASVHHAFPCCEVIVQNV